MRKSPSKSKSIQPYHYFTINEDKQLHSQNCLSWGKSVKQLKTIFNLDTLDLSHVQFSKEMSTYYSSKLMNQLIHTRNSETGKLRFFSKILAIECPIYNSVRDKFFTLYNRKFNETTEVTINRLLNPSSSQDLNNICLYLKESYSLRDSSFKKYFFIYLYHK